MMKILHWVE